MTRSWFGDRSGRVVILTALEVEYAAVRTHLSLSPSRRVFPAPARFVNPPSYAPSPPFAAGGGDIHCAWWAADFVGRAPSKSGYTPMIEFLDADEELTFSEGSTQS